MAYNKIIAVPIQINSSGTKYYAKLELTLSGTSITNVAVYGMYRDEALTTASGSIITFSGGSSSNGTGTWTNGNSGAYGKPLYQFKVASLSVSNYTITAKISSTYHKQTDSSGNATNYTNGAEQTLTASINHWSVSYNPGDHGYGSATSQVKIESTALTLKGALYTRTGYDQTGWATVDGGTQSYALGASYTTDADLTLYPVFTPRSYNVSLNANGGTINSGSINSYTYGVGATLPTNVTRTGYTFGGWYESSSLTGNRVTAIAASESGDKTYWAKWTANTYSVTLNANGGTINSGDINSYTYGVGATLPTNITRPGYTFEGWYAKSTLDGSRVTAISATDTGDKTYWAKWSINSYAVTLQTNGGTINSGSIDSYTYGVGATLPTDVTRPGYTFGGWYASSSLTGNPVTAISTIDTGDKTYWAKWTGNTYSVTLNTNGGTINSGNVSSYICGNGATLPSNVTKTGHAFGGWYDNADLTGARVTSIQTTAYGDKTYWAKWSINAYEVTLQTNGGTINSGEITSYIYGNGATLPTDVTRDGYAFAGWYASSDFSGSPVTEIPASATGAKVYYAKWIAAFNVRFVDHDGRVINEQAVLAGGDATPPDPPSRTGYAFTGWDGDYTGITADTTIKATYTILSYTVTFVDFDGTVLKTETVNYGGAATAPQEPTHDGYAFEGWSVDFSHVTGPLTVTAVYVGEFNYRVRARRWQRLYTASRITPAYAASVEASRIAETLCTVPWTEAEGVYEACLPAHSGTSDEADEANVAARASFDAAIFCSEHVQGQHRAYAQATCYRIALPESARGKRLNTVSLVAAGDPYLKHGARISILTNDTGEIPMDCATCRNGDYHVAGAVKRTVSADGQRWYGTTERITLIPPDGITLGAYLYVFVMLEDYSYTRQEYLEGAACIQPDIYLGLYGTVSGWSQDGINYCYEDAGHIYTITRGGTLAANTSAETGVWAITLQANGDALDAPACSAPAADAALGLRAIYAALAMQTIPAVATDRLGNNGRRIGAGFAARRGTATVSGSTVVAWNITMSALLIKTALPKSWRASMLVLDWSAWQGNATPGAKYNVWVKRGTYADNYSQEITKPALWDASAKSESGYELVGVIDATAAEKHAEIRLNRPLDGYVATILLTAYTPLDDDSPLATSWSKAGATTDLHVPPTGSVAGLDKTWTPDIALKG